nr:unnamed protein product [Callosobruchus analis]
MFNIFASCHDLLAQKLHRYGVRGIYLELLQSYLSCRKQCVSYNNEVSSIAQLDNGVPQGSVLGPLLFIIYINDINLAISPYKCVVYCDDTTGASIGKSEDEVEEKSTEFEALANNWFTNNSLQLNLDKTQRLTVSSNRSMTNGSSVYLLGIVVDDRLNWSAHIRHLNKKLSSGLFVIRRLRETIDQKYLIMVYHSLLHSHISYGAILWGNSTTADIIFKTQKQAIRVMAKNGYRDHCHPWFKKFGILPLPCVWLYQQLVEIHKNKNTFRKNSDNHSYNSRHGDNLLKPQFKLKISTDNSLRFELYNILGKNVKNLNDLAFKIRLKSFLLYHCYYTVNEYVTVAKTNTDLIT